MFKSRYSIFKSTIATIVLSLALAVFLSGVAFGEIIIEPVQPMVGQPITLTFNGGFGDGCWDYGVCYSSLSLVEDVNLLTIGLIATDHWKEGVYCTMDMPFYSVTQQIVLDEPGIYYVVATRYHNSLRRPDPLVEYAMFKVIEDVSTDVGDDQSDPIESFSLDQNYPNPFNPTTSIEYSLSSSEHLKLTIYNTLGRKVRLLVDEVMPAGSFEAKWDGTDDSGELLPSGVYFYRVEAGSFVSAKKMLLLK